MADHSEKISKVIGTDEIEMMFEDDFEEDNKKLAKIKEKEQKTKIEKVVKQNLVNDNKNKSRQRIKLKDKNLNIKKLDKSSEFFEKIGNIENNELQSIDKKSKSSEARFEIIEGKMGM